MSTPAAAPAAPKPTHVTCTIDGVEVKVPVGTNLVEAAASVGIEIPFYCYHKGLSIAANCRMCMVEVSNAPPGKLVPACQTAAVEGQKVQTESKRVTEQQRAVQEFLLLHHPVDCSICDQAGECKLQDYYMEFDFRPSRLDSKKWLKNKRKVLGPLVVLDQERCIMCTRCVRFMAEVAKEPVLGVFGRGTREVIDMFPGKVLDGNYSHNVVDICPVGALTSRDFRFRARSYFLTATPSICTGCARGCNTFLDHFQGVPYRYRPRENLDVNRYWMCDVGRVTYHPFHEHRVERARVGRGAEARTATPQEAARLAASALAGHAGKGRLAIVVSPVASLEDALAAMVLAKEGLKATDVYLSGRKSAVGDALLLQPDRNPNRRGAELAAEALGLNVRPFEQLEQALDEDKLDAALFVGADVPADPALVGGLLDGIDTAVVVSANEGPIAAAATILLPGSTAAEDEGTFVNFEGRSQRFLQAYAPHGESRPVWAWATAMLAELGQPHRYVSAREVFADLSRKLTPGALGEFDWEKAAPRAVLRGVTPLPGGTVDGRPPGWRELIPLKSGAAAGRVA